MVYKKDDLKTHPHCPKCGKNWCPNLTLGWHGPVELKPTMNSRGEYFSCPVCHWYSNIDRESEESAFTQEIFIKELEKCLANARPDLASTKLQFKSELAGEEPWYSLGERLKRYGKIKTPDLELLYGGKPITKFEVKGWRNYDLTRFYFTTRAHVNINEVKDAEKFDGYICFITLQDKKVICTKARDILKEWDMKKIKISSMPEEETKRAVLDEFGKGALVIIAPDKQGNYRYVLSRNYKKQYCKFLASFTAEILAKFEG